MAPKLFRAEVDIPNMHRSMGDFERISTRRGFESPEAKVEFKNIDDIVSSMKADGKFPGADLSGFKPDPTGKIDLVNKSGEKVQFDTPEGGKKSYSEAIKDSNILPELISKKSVESLGKFEGPTKLQLQSQYTKSIKDLPSRAIDVDVKAETKLKNDLQKGSSNPNMERSLNEATPENKAVETETKNNKEVQKKLDRAKKADAKAEGKLDEGLESKFDKKGKEKSEKVKEEDGFLKKNWRLVAGAIAAGFITYELAKARQKALSGCWVYDSTGDKYKVKPLICNDDWKQSGYNTKDVIPTECKYKEDNTTFIDDDCSEAKLCNNPSNGCSRTCSCDVRKCVDGNKKLEYRCVQASMSDAVSDLTGMIGRLADNTLGAAEGGIGGFLKMFGEIGKYLIFGVMIVVIVFFLYKGYQIFFAGQNRIVISQASQASQASQPSQPIQPSQPVQQKFRSRR